MTFYGEYKCLLYFSKDPFILIYFVFKKFKYIYFDIFLDNFSLREFCNLRNK